MNSVIFHKNYWLTLTCGKVLLYNPSNPGWSFWQSDSEIHVIISSTQKLMTNTEWKGAPAASLNDYITNHAPDVDLDKCKADCLEDMSKICPKDVDGNETLSVFFKCPSWEDVGSCMGMTPVLAGQGKLCYCQQQLEGTFWIHTVNFTAK